MRIAVSVLAVLFALLHIIAAAAQFRSGDPAVRGSAVLMLCGGLMLIVSAVAHVINSSPGAWMDALAAAVCGFFPICFAAYLNGRRSGNIHASHHLIRGGIAALLALGFFLW